MTNLNNKNIYQKMPQTTDQTTKCFTKTEIPTSQASRWIRRLCKHFQHKVPATWDVQKGQITFAMGSCRLNANSTTLSLYCEAEQHSELFEIVETMHSHFLRFAANDKTTS